MVLSSPLWPHKCPVAQREEEGGRASAFLSFSPEMHISPWLVCQGWSHSPKSMARKAGKEGAPWAIRSLLTAAPQPRLHPQMALYDPAQAHRAAERAWNRPRLWRLLPHTLLQHCRDGEMNNSTRQMRKLWLSVVDRLSKVTRPPRSKTRTQTQICFLTPTPVLSPPWSRCPVGTMIQGLQGKEGMKPETLREHGSGEMGKWSDGGGQRPEDYVYCQLHIVLSGKEAQDWGKQLLAR